MIPFIGRKEELENLDRLSKMAGPRLVVIKGPRRIGKSRLVEEFAKDKTFFSFSGLAPTQNVTDQDQRAVFARQFSQIFNLPPLDFPDWSDAFNHLSRYIPDTPTVILFDEISWMGSKDPTFVGKLKIWWDLHLQRYPHLMVIFCGSVSPWIEKNIIRSTAFFGRISLKITLAPLSLPECGQFLKTIGLKGSPFEFYEILSILGGIPWYLEKINPSETINANLTRLCFTRTSLLSQEFDHIFHDLFNGRGKIHKEIIHHLGTGNKTLANLRTALNYPHSGTFGDIVQDLITAGFVTKHYQWSIKTGKAGKQSLYRLRDCYVRFYLKYIEPNRQRIEQGSFGETPVQQLPGWEPMMGIQVESLLLENHPLLLRALGINPADIENDGPYLRQKTVRYQGCQIDYLIQTSARTLYVCEFKFKRRGIGPEIIDSMKDKISRFAAPKGFGVAPVLLHLGDVSDSVYNKNYFYRIIDIADLLG